MVANNTFTTSAQGQASGYKRLDIARVRANVNKYVERYNSAVGSRGHRVRGAMLLTLLRICDAYVRQNQFLHAFTNNPAPCRLNNCMLASQLKMVKRTAINHLRRLSEAGFIEKKFRGTNADFEIWVNPAVLLNNPLLLPYFSASSTVMFAKRITEGKTPTLHNEQSEAVYRSEVKSLPYICIRTYIEISNKRGNSVNNPVSDSINSGLHTPQAACTADNKALATFSCHPPKANVEIVNNQKNSTVQEKEKKGGAAGGPKKQIPRWQQAMVLEFYQYFINTLYPFRTYEGEIRRNILNKIYFDVYFKFSDSDFSCDDWEKYQLELFERVNIVRRWLNSPLNDKKAKEYTDGKFLVNPLTFLDKNCKYGFKNTAYWLDLTYKRRALIKAELELDKATKEILSDADRLRVYRKWETRFKNKKLPEAMELFYRCMTNIQNRFAALKAQQ